MKNAFYMNDLRGILGQLDKKEITMSKALEILNEKADLFAKESFDRAWSLRMNKKGSQLDGSWKEWKSGDRKYQHS